MVVDEQEVERLAHRHFPPAQPAQGDRGEGTAGNAAVDGGEGIGDRRQGGGEAGVGDVRERARGLDRREEAAEHVHADMEDLVVGPAPLGVEEILHVARPAGLRRECRPHFRHAELADVEQAHEAAARGVGERRFHLVRVRHVEVGEFAAEHAVEQHRPAAQAVGEARGRGHDFRNQIEQRRARREHREEVRTGGQASQKLVEERERGIGVGRGREGLQQRRHEGGHAVAGLVAAHGAVTTGVPGPDRRRSALGRRVAHAGQGLQRLRVVVSTGEDQGPGRRQRGLVLEQSRVVALHRPQVGEERLGESTRGLEPHERGDVRDAFLVLRHAVGLPVVDHLQPMFERAVETVGCHQLGRRAAAHVPGRHQPVERLPGAAHAQGFISPAPDELLGLGQELDLADAAAPELDVVSGDGDPAAAAMGVDLPLDRADMLDGREIEMATPDEGLQRIEEALPGLQVAGHRPRLDHGGALPVLAGAGVIDLRGADGERGGRRGRVRAQAEVGAEDVAVGRALVHDRDEVAGQPGEGLLQAAGVRIGGLVEEDDHVHVARIVELAGAELPHPEDDQPGVALGLVGRGQGEGAGLVRLPQQVGGGRGERRGGEVGERRRHLFQRPRAGDVGHADGEAGAPLGDSQALHRRRPRFAAGVDIVARRRQRGGEGVIRPAFQQQPGERLVRDEAAGEIAAVAEERVQQRLGGGVGPAAFGEGGERGVPALAGALKPLLPVGRQRRHVAGAGRRGTCPAWGYVRHPRRSIMGRRPRAGRPTGEEPSCRKSTPTESTFSTNSWAKASRWR